MKYLLLSLCAILLSFSAAAQLSDKDAAAISSFIPKGYKLLKEYSADLNLDSLPDKIIVVGVDKSLGDSLLHILLPSGTNLQKRPVVILLRQSDGSLKRVTRNDQAVAQLLGSTDPFAGIKCRSGSFTIEHVNTDAIQTCTVEARFEWNMKQSDWYLKSYSQSCISVTPSTDPNAGDFKEKTPKNFGKIPFGKFKYPMSVEVDEWGQ
ncbi:MAG TPA: hypothetical protein VGO45_10080 [Bacteroidia bacterium]|jgi:hypothetical protein|nr:hypothetical protein [Bacteroidia bacterium]